MKIVADKNIPFLKGVFEHRAEVVYLPGGEISRNDLLNADALITRTRTRCTEQLLAGTNVKFIATATIGFDHIDGTWCKKNGIEWTNCPGCNSSSVAQYVTAALLHWSKTTGESLKNKVIGIVGVGNVGSKAAAAAGLLGMKVLLNDPPRAAREGNAGFTSLSDLCKNADFISFHVPLNRNGEFRTLHLADETFFSSLARKPVILNTSRGEVADTAAFQAALITKRISAAIIDVWENEPDINDALLQLALLGTPHIAGYSTDGKANGTAMSVRAIANFFDFPELKDFYPVDVPEPEQPVLYLADDRTALYDAVRASYDIAYDDSSLRTNPDLFESLRGKYRVRREARAFRIDPASSVSADTRSKLHGLGFQC